jgi:EVE domain
MKYWIKVVSKEHALAGMAGGFAQAHGDEVTHLRSLDKGDLIFFYSPGTLFRAGEILQAFTAVARVTDDAPYEVKTSARVHPWRRKTMSLACEEVPVAALIPRLDFITDKVNWGTSLRRSLFEIGEDDARRLADVMKADLEGSWS